MIWIEYLILLVISYIVDDFDVRDVINTIEEETGIIHKG